VTATEALTLRKGDVICELAPSLGGALLRLSVAGSDLLRPSRPEVDDIHEVACFTMLPFANRIAFGRLRAHGRDISVGSDPEGHPHALHGHGWRNPWKCVAQGDSEATLRLDYPGGSWPWPYLAEQKVRLSHDGVEISVAIKNCHATEPMPAGVGLHPYFVRHPSSAIVADASMRWRSDETGLAIAPIADNRLCNSRLCAVDDLEGTDHYFDLNKPHAIVSGVARLEGDAVTGLHIYVPGGSDFFCVEPVSHIPNSFGRGEYRPQDFIQPGASRAYCFSVKGQVIHQ
jgi:aldose 1-epimerase